jgi:hypothetical protein
MPSNRWLAGTINELAARFAGASPGCSWAVGQSELSEKCVFMIVSAKKFHYNAALGDAETLACELLVLHRESEVA